jgi:hypothetical protein
LAVWFILLICSTAPSDSSGPHILSRCLAEAASSVTIEQSSQWNAAIYNISSGDCTIQWIVRNSEIGVIKYWSQCRLSLAEQLPLLEKICGEFFSKDRNAQAFRTLFWGRLEPDSLNGSRELSLRLALAAHKSPGWDAKRGKPKNGDINEFVRDIANREMIFPELKELFARFHKNITFSCAEKVLVLKAEKLPFFDQLKQQGVKASDKLPFDCMTWFSVVEILQK